MAWAQHQTDFYNKVWSSVQEVARRIGVSAEIIFAQLALESNWGRSELTRTANNFGGIKAVGNEPYVIRRTREVFNGVSTYINARFKKYDSVQEGIAGYGEFITNNPRYQAFVGANTIDEELRAIQASGYATDPQYSAKLRSVINNMPSFNKAGPAARKML
jgi:flagellar protein FlgJ